MALEISIDGYSNSDGGKIHYEISFSCGVQSGIRLKRFSDFGKLLAQLSPAVKLQVAKLSKPNFGQTVNHDLRRATLETYFRDIIKESTSASDGAIIDTFLNIDRVELAPRYIMRVRY
jgi:hypothetical protein